MPIPLGTRPTKVRSFFLLAFATNHIYYEWVRYIHAAGR